MEIVERIQSGLRKHGIEAWLFCDHHHRDPIAYRILGLSASSLVSRRWFYLIPAQGKPSKLVHAIEPFHLDSLPGETRLYAEWQEFVEGLGRMLSGVKDVAMQFSSNNMLFVLSVVDAGTVDLVRGFGVNVVSSADMVAALDAVWSESQIRSHFAARDAIDSIVKAAFHEISDRVRRSGCDEFAMQQWMVEAFHCEGIVADGPPIVAVNRNSSNPHYLPSSANSASIREGDVVLFDVWGKKNTPDAVYYDISWVAFVGANVPERAREIFHVVLRSRDAAIEKVQAAIAAGARIAGWEVDKAARDVLISASYGEYLRNRVGHSIGVEVHGSGANIDNFESRDERLLLENTCFSIEPGIYLPEFGMRSEVNMLVRKDAAEVTGMIQRELLVL